MAYDGSIVSSGTSQLACQPKVCQPQLGLGFAVVFRDAGRGSKWAGQQRAVDCSAEDSRTQWFWSHSVLITVVSSTVVGNVAALLGIPMPAAAILVDVVSSVVSPLIIDEVLLDGRGFPSSRGWSLMNRHLPLVSGWLDTFLCGCPPTLRGRAFGLLGYRHLEQSLHLVSNAPRLGVGRFRHVTQQHGCRHDILVRSWEAGDKWQWLLVFDDLMIHLSSTTVRAFGVRMRLVSFEGPLELSEALVVLVELGFELP